MNPKQDRPAARTPEDLERKYNFGENFHEIKETIQQQNVAMEKQSQWVSNFVGMTDKEMKELAENYAKLLERVSTLEGNLTKVDNMVTNTDNKVTNTADSLCKVKAGFIYPFAGNKAPDGFLLCNGSSYSRTSYPELFAAIGTTYGAGDGSTTFNVPNYAGRVLVGAGSGYVLGATGGEEKHTLTIGEMPYHRHDTSPVVPAGATAGDVAGPEWNLTGVDWGKPSTDYAGGDQPHNNMQPYAVANYIIATGKTFVNTST